MTTEANVQVKYLPKDAKTFFAIIGSTTPEFCEGTVYVVTYNEDQDRDQVSGKPFLCWIQAAEIKLKGYDLFVFLSEKEADEYIEKDFDKLVSTLKATVGSETMYFGVWEIKRKTIH